MDAIELNGDKARSLTRPVYYQCIWIVRDMERLRNLVGLQIIGGEAADTDIVFYTNEMESLIPIEVITQARFKLGCIRDAIKVVPEELREGIIRNIVEGEKFSDMEITTENTWKIWKHRFVQTLARKLNIY